MLLRPREVKRLPRVTYGRAVSLDKEFSHDSCSRTLFPETHLYGNFCLRNGRKGILELFTRPQSKSHRNSELPREHKEGKVAPQALGQQQSPVTSPDPHCDLHCSHLPFLELL